MEDQDHQALQAALQDFQRLQHELLHHLQGKRVQRRRRHQRFRHIPIGTPAHHDLPPQPATHYTPLARMTLTQGIQHRTQLQAYMSMNRGFPTTFTPDEVSFVVDTGASITITHNKQDFVSPIRCIQPTTLQGITFGLSVEGIGDAEYVFRMDNQHVSILLRNVLYIPSCSIQLLCPRHLTENTQHRQDGFNSLRDHGVLTCHGQVITVPYHKGTGLPILTTASGTDAFDNFCSAYASSSFNDSSTKPNQSSLSPVHFKQNLTAAQRAKLILH